MKIFFEVIAPIIIISILTFIAVILFSIEQRNSHFITIIESYDYEIEIED